MSKQIQTDPIYNQIDLILFEEGSFSPLNWLLREGHLDYSVYQNWKKGQTGYLEDHFKTSNPEIKPGNNDCAGKSSGLCRYT